MINRPLPILFISLGINLFLIVFVLSKIDIKLPFQKNDQVAQIAASSKVVTNSEKSGDDIFNEINPQKGFEIEVSYEDLGPKMVKSGVIDLEKFRAVFERSGQPLTDEQEEILTKGSTRKIKITRDNSYFLLNFFWAVGLANNSKILTSGEMVEYGGEKDLGNFASTGGWTLGIGEAMNYYSKSSLIPLTVGQEGLVEAVASKIFRPCCNNSTAFPDCNHGMALLGVLELLAGSGASQDEMFNAAKYFNAYWFPGNYYDLAVYFKNKEGQSFDQIDPRILLSKDYSSASGWQKAKRWLVDRGIVQEPPKQGGGCGV
ncbi:MAG: hypothetical protein UY21_C0003G0027 [Microgenomates group bacterium GW2011_GWA1_48_10]|nr:MAG: hypothetical protein UY21_C0003G0027 [Microgenomates group bacterium GW2011_GWA1_48_10]